MTWQERGLQPILGCDSRLRGPLRRYLKPSYPNLVLLAWEEISPEITIRRAELNWPAAGSVHEARKSP